jgi:hypothetical protein
MKAMNDISTIDDLHVLSRITILVDHYFARFLVDYNDQVHNFFCRSQDKGCCNNVGPSATNPTSLSLQVCASKLCKQAQGRQPSCFQSA